MSAGIVLAVIVSLAAWSIWLARQDPSGTARPSGDGTASPPAGVPGRPAGAERLTVRYVYDGDTLQLQAARPGRFVTTTGRIRVRLIGIDAPEMRPEPECFGPEATDRLRALAGPGTTVWVTTDRESPDRYGRPLFLVWTDDGRLVNSELVAEGYAEAIRARPNVTYWPLLSEANTAAKASRRGLWSAC